MACNHRSQVRLFLPPASLTSDRGEQGFEVRFSLLLKKFRIKVVNVMLSIHNCLFKSMLRLLCRGHYF